MKGKLFKEPLFYIYKIEFNSGETYIGSHIQYKDNDKYICSSMYWKRHPELTIKSREILFYLPSLEQMNIMETICIISDKCNSPKNINGNYGNWLYNFHSKLDCPWNKGLKVSDEMKKRISETESEPLICIETLELLENGQSNSHFAAVASGKRKTIDGKHYRKVTIKEKEKILKGDLEETLLLNKNFLIEIDGDKSFYYCIENNIAWESKEPICKMLGIPPSRFNELIGTTYKGLTFKIVDSCFIYNNNISVIKIKKEKKSLGKKVKCVETGEVFNSVKEACEKYNNHISSVINGNRKTACGYHWKLIP